MRTRVYFACAMLFAATTLPAQPRFGILDDGDSALTREERALWTGWMKDALLVEDFADREVARLEGVRTANIHNGVLEVDRDGQQLYFESQAGFTRALVCYRLTSSSGHLYTPIGSPDGHFALFNDALGDWAWLDFEHGRQRIDVENFGEPSASNRNLWVVHELRVEGGELCYFVDGELFASVPFQRSGKMTNFAVAANIGGRGAIDYVIIADRLPSGESEYHFAGYRIVCSHGYTLEALVPPSLTAPAPFDSTIAPDGSILMAGTQGVMTRIEPDGTITRTNIPDGTNFECTRDGTVWYFDYPSGLLTRWTRGQAGREILARLPASYSDASLAVSPDGTVAYVAWWIRDADQDKEKSALYRYDDRSGLRKLLELPQAALRAVEVAPDGTVYVATTKGIARLNRFNRLDMVYPLRDLYLTSDGLTSDRAGYLYFTADGPRAGLYRVRPGVAPKLVAAFRDELELPFGLSFHEPSKRVVCVRKQTGELFAIDKLGVIEVLNEPSRLANPIAVKGRADGTVFVNGDEVGLLRVDANGKVSVFRTRLVSYQPPPADFVFAGDGTILYTCAAPGFESSIIRIAADGASTTVTRNVGAPAGIDVGPDGRIYYADYERGIVCRLRADGSSNILLRRLNHPVGLTVDDAGRIWVGVASPFAEPDPDGLGEVSSTRILRFVPGDFPVEVFRHEEKNRGITFFDVDVQGNLYVADHERVVLRTVDGERRSIAAGFGKVRAARVVGDGSILLTDTEAGALYRLWPPPPEVRGLRTDPR